MIPAGVLICPSLILEKSICAQPITAISQQSPSYTKGMDGQTGQVNAKRLIHQPSGWLTKPCRSGMLGPMETYRNRLNSWRDARLGRITAEIGAYAGFALRRFHHDRGMQSASSLTYTTLLSLVPLMAIAFAIFAAFPTFQDAREQLEAVIFANLVPGVGGEIRGYLNDFLKNTGQLGTVGVVALGVSALLLLSTIEATFNRIWRVERPRPLIVRFLVYWGVLTLGPLLIAAAITLTTDVFSVARDGLSQVGMGAGTLSVDAGGLAEQMLSVSVQTLLFTGLFAVVPNRRIPWREALIGGFVSGAGFQILKIGFAWYLANALSYQTIYGAVAVFPIFLIWLYLSWCVVLLGAVFAAAFPVWWRARDPALEAVPGSGHTLAVAIQSLAALSRGARTGGEMTAEKISDAVGGAPVETILKAMLAGRFVCMTQAGAFVLSRDLAAATVYDLYDCLGLTVAAADASIVEVVGVGETGSDAGASASVAALIDGLRKAEQSALDQPLERIVSRIGERLGDL